MYLLIAIVWLFIFLNEGFATGKWDTTSILWMSLSLHAYFYEQDKKMLLKRIEALEE